MIPLTQVAYTCTLTPHVNMIFTVSVLTASEEPRVKKLLVQHIETVHHSEAVQDVLHSLLVIIVFFSLLLNLSSLPQFGFLAWHNQFS
jgi:hypothetical protein